MPKVILTFPPFIAATSPPPGVCALKGYLGRTVPEWEVSVEDLNLRTHAALINGIRNGGRLNPRTFPNGVFDEVALLRADEVFHGLHPGEFYDDPVRYTLYGDMILRLLESEMQGSLLLEDILGKNAPLPPLLNKCAEFLLNRKPDAIGISVCHAQQAWFSMAPGEALRERSSCPIFSAGLFSFMISRDFSEEPALSRPLWFPVREKRLSNACLSPDAVLKECAALTI